MDVQASEQPQLPQGLQPVEILHIDTEDSQLFFFGANPSEKCQCQKRAEDLFAECCQEAGGYVRDWAGDGGHAYFHPSLKSGNSILAAEKFISKLSVLAHQTSTILGRTPTYARRKFRVKAHFGLVFISDKAGNDSGKPEDFDAFFKNEKLIAQTPDEFYVTKEYWEQLGHAEKNRFACFATDIPLGSKKTSIYRLRCQPEDRARNILETNQAPQNLTDNEWKYLQDQIVFQKMNIAARNSITTRLIESIYRKESDRVDDDNLMQATLRALYNYLRSAYPHLAFKISFWRQAVTSDAILEKIGIYPSNENTVGRKISLNDSRYQLVTAYNLCIPIVTPSVDEARLNGEWVDFDESQKDSAHGLRSAVQLPIYRTETIRGECVKKEVLAVISLQCDKPDFFVRAELDIWVNDFTGFLANLALAEALRHAKTTENTAK